MTPDDRLTEVFDRGFREGVDALTPIERDLYLIQEFIIDYEMGHLSGYFYNRLPDITCILAAVAAMRRNRLTRLADLLGEAAELFEGYIDPDPPSTWKEVLRKYDPANLLIELDRRIKALEGYGLCDSTIAS